MARTMVARYVRLYRLGYGNNLWYILATVMLSGVCALGSSFTPLIGKRLFDVAVPHKNVQAIISNGCLWIIGMELIILLRCLSDYLLRWLDIEAEKELNKYSFQAFLTEMKDEGTPDNANGERLSRICIDPEAFVNNCGIGYVMRAALDALIAIGIAVVALCLDFQLAVISIIAASVALSTQWKAPKKIGMLSGTVAQVRAKVLGEIERQLAFWKTIIRANKIEKETEIAGRTFAEIAGAKYTVSRYRYLWQLFCSVLITPLPIILLSIGAYRIMIGTATFGTLIAFTQYFLLLMSSLGSLYASILGISSGLGQAHKIANLISERLYERPIKRDNLHGEARINRIKIAQTLITAGTFQLQSDEICLERGKCYLVCGESGVGKSLFLELLVGMRKPECARFYLNGKESSIEEYQEIARTFGYVSKNEVLLNRSCQENMTYYSTDPKYDASFMDSWIKHLRIDEYMRATITGLSAGENARIAFVRELTRQSPLYVIDEGLDSLDNTLKKKAYNLLREALPAAIVVICTHNWGDYADVDGIIEIREGRVIQHRAGVLVQQELDNHTLRPSE